jgi:hypothetical protein
MSSSLGDKITELLDFLSRRTVPNSQEFSCSCALLTKDDWKEFTRMELEVFQLCHQQRLSIPDPGPSRGIWPTEYLGIGWCIPTDHDLQNEHAKLWLTGLTPEQKSAYVNGVALFPDQRWIDGMMRLRSHARATDPNPTKVANETEAERLKFDIETSTITLDGKLFSPCPAVPFRLLKALWEHREEWPITGPSLQARAKFLGKNLHREFEKLSKPLRDIIDATSAGFRVVLPIKS